MEEVVVGALGPTPRTLVDLFGENADGSRNGDAQVVEKSTLELGVEPSRRHTGVRQPGERDVVEDVIPRKVAVGLTIDEEFCDVPVARHVMVDHPGCKGDR